MTNMVGTQAYRAPELLLGDVKYNKAVDIWSLGCTIYEIFSKKILFDSTTEIAHLGRMFNLFPACGAGNYLKSLPLYESLAGKLAKEEKGFCCCTLNSVPEGLRELVTRMLDINPDTRITAKEAIELILK